MPEQEGPQIPSSVMLFMAVAIPLIVVTVASVVYFQRGRADQFSLAYDQAIQAAETARAMESPGDQIRAWQEVLKYLDQAEQVQSNETTQALRTEAQSSFDQWENVERLEYQPAIVNGLSTRVQITALAATNNSIYILNDQNGSAIQATQSERGYEINDNFACQSGGGADFGKVIDITAPSNPGGTDELLALTENSGVFRCSDEHAPLSLDLAEPLVGWNSPQFLTENRGHLFILDPGANAIWVYWNSNYIMAPESLFAGDPPPLHDIVDMAVANDDLYLLHQDGHMTLCTFNTFGLAPTRCNDPAPYVDSRTNREEQPLLIAGPFSQIAITQSPDPALYLLEPSSQATYQFSLRLLTFQRQYRPAYASGLDTWQFNQATSAFTISQEARIAFLAFDNQLYYASIR